MLSLPPSRQSLIQPLLADSRMSQIKQAILADKQRGITVYPPGPVMLDAYRLTPLDQIRVVILGQDPYHGVGQAHGLSFSVPEGISIPPSLVNIFKEIAQEQEQGMLTPETVSSITLSRIHGDLTRWAQQGVFLLNTLLSVQAANPLSHQHIGRQWFTDETIKMINQHTDHVVFLLRGAHAQSKASLIDVDRHLLLRAPHPSPLSAHRGFMGCGHFAQANQHLIACGRDPIVR